MPCLAEAPSATRKFCPSEGCSAARRGCQAALSFSTCYALAATLSNLPLCQSQLLSQGSDFSLCCSKRSRRWAPGCHPRDAACGLQRVPSTARSLSVRFYPWVLVSKTLTFTEHEAGGELLPNESIHLSSSRKASCLPEGSEDLLSYFLLREKNLAQLIVGPLRGQISPTVAIITFFSTFSSPSFPSFRGSPPSPISFSDLQTLALWVLPAPFSGSVCIHSEAFLAHLSLTSMSAARQPRDGSSQALSLFLFSPA